jgi:hypothetical protein
MSLTQTAAGLSVLKSWFKRFSATGSLCFEFVVTLNFLLRLEYRCSSSEAGTDDYGCNLDSVLVHRLEFIQAVYPAVRFITLLGYFKDFSVLNLSWARRPV